MSFEKNANGAELASGKAKGAFGINHMLAAVMAVAMSEGFTSASVDVITRIRNVCSEWELKASGSTFEGMYEVHAVDDQTMCYGTVWLDIGNSYKISLHWEILTLQERRAIEMAVTHHDRLISEQPIILNFEAKDVDNVETVITRMEVIRQAIGHRPMCKEQIFI